MRDITGQSDNVNSPQDRLDYIFTVCQRIVEQKNPQDWDLHNSVSYRNDVPGVAALAGGYNGFPLAPRLMAFPLAALHLDPLPWNPPSDQTLGNDPDMLPLRHDLLQLRVSWVRLYGRRRCTRRLQFLHETVCVEAEDLETRNTRDPVGTGNPLRSCVTI